MKTFAHLIQEVQEKGLCHHCGGCVAFCTANNYRALELGEAGRPRYRNKEKCIECGICYSMHRQQLQSPGVGRGRQAALPQYGEMHRVRHLLLDLSRNQ